MQQNFCDEIQKYKKQKKIKIIYFELILGKKCVAIERFYLISGKKVYGLKIQSKLFIKNIRYVEICLKSESNKKSLSIKIEKNESKYYIYKQDILKIVKFTEN